MVQRIRIIRLEYVAGEQERQQKTQATPHPRVESLDGDVHVVSFAQRLQPIEDALLVAELQILHHADVRVEVHELQTEQLPGFALGPDEQDAGANGRDEVMGAPPALDAGSVHLQNRLANR